MLFQRSFLKGVKIKSFITQNVDGFLEWMHISNFEILGDLWILCAPDICMRANLGKCAIGSPILPKGNTLSTQYFCKNLFLCTLWWVRPLHNVARKFIAVHRLPVFGSFRQTKWSKWYGSRKSHKRSSHYDQTESETHLSLAKQEGQAVKWQPPHLRISWIKKICLKFKVCCYVKD